MAETDDFEVDGPIGRPRDKQTNRRRFSRVPDVPIVRPEHFEDVQRVDGEKGAAACEAAWRNVAKVMDGFARGGAVFVVSCGHFSQLDLIAWVLERVIGGDDLDVDLWSYISSNACGEALAGWARRGRFRRLRVVMDASGMKLGMASLYAGLQRELGDVIRLAQNHAKIVAISDRRPGGWRVVIEGSANLTRNPRFEQSSVRDAPGQHAFVEALTDEVFATTPVDLAKWDEEGAQDLVAKEMGAQRGRRAARSVRTPSPFGRDFVG